MKTPIDEPYPGALEDLLQGSNQFVMSEVYTFTLADGTTLVYRGGADQAPNVGTVAPGEATAPVIT